MLSVEDSAEGARFARMGDDEIATYYRVWIPVTQQINAYGIYIIPKDVGPTIPLMISMHGGGGSPEGALFGPGNYNGMVRKAAEQGYAVWAPQHLFRAEGYPDDVRNQMDARLRLVGTSLTAIETAKITRPIDVLIRGAAAEGHTHLDESRIGMVGLSYGGYYAIVVRAALRSPAPSVCSPVSEIADGVASAGAGARRAHQGLGLLVLRLRPGAPLPRGRPDRPARLPLPGPLHALPRARDLRAGLPEGAADPGRQERHVHAQRPGAGAGHRCVLGGARPRREVRVRPLREFSPSCVSLPFAAQGFVTERACAGGRA